MYDASEIQPQADEIVAAVRRLQERLDDALDVADILRWDRDEARRQLEEATEETKLAFMPPPMPQGRRWIYFEDSNVVAMSSDVDAETELQMLAQLARPELRACEVCGAPFWSNASCGMHDDA